MQPRVRFAPSPTGYLHVGGARTALFNWLYARRHGGTFILRIEDTDVERSSTDMVTGILQSLRWLGLDWDEGPDVGGPHAPYFQSERRDRYQAAAQQLVSSGHAYYCYCKPDALKARRDAAEAAGQSWTYDRTCRGLSTEDIAALEAAKTPRAIRFKVLDGRTSFDDMVHGAISVDHATIEDFVVLRSDGHPTYHLSVVVDDVEMKITQVVRGDDHISNTPKQILLYRAMGAAEPAFAHVPLILGPDKKRLSKRHGATSVGEYKKDGILPEAMVNFLALLGWSPGKGDQEVFTREELVARFTLEGISGGNAVFNPEKLAWFNQQHIMRLPGAEILNRLTPALEAAGLTSAALADRPRTERAIDLVKPRAKKLEDIAAQIRPFITDAIERDPAAVAKHLSDGSLAPHLDAWRARLAGVTPFEAAPIEAALRALAEERGIKPAALIHATRVAVTGQAVSAGVFEVLELVGRDRVMARLDGVVPSMTPYRALTPDEFERARRILMRRDPKLAVVIKKVGRCGLPDSRGHEPFGGLVRVIASQQLSGKAADTIFGRVVTLAGGPGALTPDVVKTLDATALRAAGLSRQKISYLYDLADHVLDGRLDLHALDGHPDEDVLTAITAVKGLGRWSAEMFLMFRLNRPDIFPIGDLGIVKGMQRLHGMKRRPAPRTMERLAEPWRPYRSIAAWYLWRLV